MTTPQVLFICITCLGLALICAYVCVSVANAPKPQPPVPTAPTKPRKLTTSGATVVVHTHDGRSIRGIVARAPDHLELIDAAYLDNGVPHALGGTQKIPRQNVSFLQELAEAPAQTTAAEPEAIEA